VTEALNWHIRGWRFNKTDYYLQQKNCRKLQRTAWTSNHSRDHNEYSYWTHSTTNHIFTCI